MGHTCCKSSNARTLSERVLIGLVSPNGCIVGLLHSLLLVLSLLAIEATMQVGIGN